MHRRPTSILLTAALSLLVSLSSPSVAEAESVPAMPCECNEDCKPYGYDYCGSWGFCSWSGPGTPCTPRLDKGVPDEGVPDKGVPDTGVPDMGLADQKPKPPISGEPTTKTCNCDDHCKYSTYQPFCRAGVCSDNGPGQPCGPDGPPPTNPTPADRGGCSVAPHANGLGALGGALLLVTLLGRRRKRRD